MEIPLALPVTSAANAIAKLSDALTRGQLVILCGTGVTAAATRGSQVSSWKGLIEDGIDRVASLGAPDAGWADRARGDVNTERTVDMVVAAEKVTSELTSRTGAYEQWLKDSAGRIAATDTTLLESVARLHLAGAIIVTTNYDDLIVRATGSGFITPRNGTARLQAVFRGDALEIIHLHGHWSDPDSVIFGSSSYARIVDSLAVQALLTTLVYSKTILYVGVGEGLADPNFQNFRQWASKILEGSPYPSYRLVLSGQVAAVQAEHVADNFQVVSYGDDHSRLPTFLDQIIPTSTPARSRVTLSTQRPARPTGQIDSDQIGSTALEELADLAEAAKVKLTIVDKQIEAIANQGHFEDETVAELAFAREPLDDVRHRDTSTMTDEELRADVDLLSRISNALLLFANIAGSAGKK